MQQSQPHYIVRLEEEQQQLENVLGTISNIRTQALQIGHELDEQSILIGKLDGDMDHTEVKVSRARDRVEHFYRHAVNKKYNITISVLIGILVILLLVLLFA